MVSVFIAIRIQHVWSANQFRWSLLLSFLVLIEYIIDIDITLKLWPCYEYSPIHVAQLFWKKNMKPANGWNIFNKRCAPSWCHEISDKSHLRTTEFFVRPEKCKVDYKLKLHNLGRILFVNRCKNYERRSIRWLYRFFYQIWWTFLEEITVE